MFLFNIGGHKIPISEFLLLESFLLIGERFIWKQKDISISFLCFSAFAIAVCKVHFHDAARHLGSHPANA